MVGARGWPELGVVQQSKQPTTPYKSVRCQPIIVGLESQQKRLLMVASPRKKL